MNIEKFKQAIDYSDVYNLIAVGNEEMESLDAALKEKAANSSALQRRRKWLLDEPAYLSIEDGLITYDVSSLSKDIDELRGIVIPEWFDRIQSRKLDERMQELVSRNEKLTTLKDSYEKTIAEQNARIEVLEKELQEAKAELLKADLSRKVIVSSSIKIGPVERDFDEIYLTDPTHYCDIEKCVAKYGGILDSFYQEIPDDKEEESFEQGHDLTLRNYLLKVMKTVGTERFFKKRIKDNAEAKKIRVVIMNVLGCSPRRFRMI